MKKIYEKYKEQILYLIFGGLTILISLAVYYVLNKRWGESDIAVTAAYVLSWTAGATFAYVTNKIFVFESKIKGFKALARETISFFAARLATLIISYLGLMLLKKLFPTVNTNIFNFIMQIIVIILNYVASKLFIFKGEKTK